MSEGRRSADRERKRENGNDGDAKKREREVKTRKRKKNGVKAPSKDKEKEIDRCAKHLENFMREVAGRKQKFRVIHFLVLSSRRLDFLSPQVPKPLLSQSALYIPLYHPRETS